MCHAKTTVHGVIVIAKNMLEAYHQGKEVKMNIINNAERLDIFMEHFGQCYFKGIWDMNKMNNLICIIEDLQRKEEELATC